MHRYLINTVAFAILAGTCLIVAMAPAHAQTVAPGHTLNLDTPQSGERQCRKALVTLSDSLCADLNNTYSRARHSVHAEVQTALTASYAKVSLKNRFGITGTPGHWVNVQISTDYDINVDGNNFNDGNAASNASKDSIQVFGNGSAEYNLMLEVRDITSGSGFPITTHSLYQLRRDNTQGITDVTGAFERQIKPDETGHFNLMLATGRTYQLSFTLEVMGGALVGVSSSNGTASWNRLSVTVDEDEVELLDDLAVALQQHDDDIKARLDHVDDQLQEIKTLLLTPQGKRPDWNDK